MCFPAFSSLARMLLRDIVEKPTQEGSGMYINTIIEKVSRHYGTDVADVLSQSREGKLVTARQVALYFARKLTTRSLPEIAIAFGITHASVLHAVRVVEKRINVDESFRTEIEQMRQQLESEGRQKLGVSGSGAEATRWLRIQSFIQEAGLVLDYLHWRVLCKRCGDQPAPTLFMMTADADGELTEEMIVEQLEAIARQARAGFVDGHCFPVFASRE